MRHRLRIRVKAGGLKKRKMAGNIHLPLLAQDRQCTQQAAQRRVIIPVLEAPIPPHLPPGKDVDGFIKGKRLGVDEHGALRQVDKKQKNRQQQCPPRSYGLCRRNRCVNSLFECGAGVHRGELGSNGYNLTSAYLKLPAAESETEQEGK